MQEREDEAVSGVGASGVGEEGMEHGSTPPPSKGIFSLRIYHLMAPTGPPEYAMFKARTEKRSGITYSPPQSSLCQWTSFFILLARTGSHGHR